MSLDFAIGISSIISGILTVGFITSIIVYVIADISKAQDLITFKKRVEIVIAIFTSLLLLTLVMELILVIFHAVSLQ